ncbi:MAG: thiamine pyrophosphate-dependent enzyme [Candidatus Hodarchaeota archaeon]
MKIGELIENRTFTGYMLCNEAIFRAAIENDVKIASFYPGTPLSEILNVFSEGVNSLDYKMEISINEKVALETATGGAMAGLRAISAMKSVGLNVASDTFYSLAYTGVKGGLVLVVGDDPSCHSSQTEQDGRTFAYNGYVPMLEPSDPQEAYNLVKLAYEISEKFQTLVVIRTTTRVNHYSGLVKVKEYKREPFQRVSWTSESRDFKTVGAFAREKKLKLMEKFKEIEKYVDTLDVNKVFKKDSKIGIITSGISFNYVMDAINRLDLNSSVLKLTTTNPLPKDTIIKFIENLEKLIIIEELTPFLEVKIKAIAKDSNPNLKIYGKLSRHFSENFEYSTSILIKALCNILDIKISFNYDGYESRARNTRGKLPPRIPTFCPGCPHRATFYAVQKAIKGEKMAVMNDIGCYSMLIFPPYEMTEVLLDMGSGVGIGTGVSQSIKEPVLCVVGDSTFFHATIPAIINAVHNEDDIKILILQNAVTAMTGQQVHPGNFRKAGNQKAVGILIKNLLEGIGVKNIQVMFPFNNTRQWIDPIKEILKTKGPSVIISNGTCALHADRIRRRRGEKRPPFAVDKDKCKKDYSCIRNFYCPAIMIDEKDRKTFILAELCNGCGVCSNLCPHGAIYKIEGDK